MNSPRTQSPLRWIFLVLGIFSGLILPIAAGTVYLCLYSPLLSFAAQADAAPLQVVLINLILALLGCGLLAKVTMTFIELLVPFDKYARHMRALSADDGARETLKRVARSTFAVAWAVVVIGGLAWLYANLDPTTQRGLLGELGDARSTLIAFARQMMEGVSDVFLFFLDDATKNRLLALADIHPIIVNSLEASALVAALKLVGFSTVVAIIQFIGVPVVFAWTRVGGSIAR